MEKIIKLRLNFRLPDFSFCTCSSTPLVEEECRPDSIFVDLVVQYKHLWAATNSCVPVCPALGGTRYTEIGWNTRARIWSTVLPFVRVVFAAAAGAGAAAALLLGWPLPQCWQ